MGERHGEKLHEVLLSKQERVKAIDLEKYFKIPADPRGLNYESYYEGKISGVDSLEEYNSKNTDQLTVEELSTILLGLNLIHREIE